MSEELAVATATLETPATPEISSEVSQDLNTPATEPEVKVEKPTLQDDNLIDNREANRQRKHDKKVAALNRTIGEQKARAEMLQRQLEESRPKPEVKTDGLRLEDFDFDVEKYAEAKAKAAEKSALERYHTEQRTQTQQQVVKQIVDGWESKVSKADGKYDNFDEVVGELTPTSHITIAIMQAENGADIAYYLGNNLNEARRIADLDPITAIREIGRLEAKLLAEPLKAKEPSKAPAPIVPLHGKASSVDSIPSDSDDIKTWMRKERARQKKASA